QNYTLSLHDALPISEKEGGTTEPEAGSGQEQPEDRLRPESSGRKGPTEAAARKGEPSAPELPGETGLSEGCQSSIHSSGAPGRILQQGTSAADSGRFAESGNRGAAQTAGAPCPPQSHRQRLVRTLAHESEQR